MKEIRLSRLPLRVAATLTLAAGIFSAPGQAWAEPVGFVAAVVGSVEIQPTGTMSWAAAMVDRDIELGDTVRTGPASAIKMLLADETILALGESTELVIDSYIVGAAATRDPSILKLLKGRARALVGEAFGGPTRLEMHTPTAVIGVKGTEFEVYVVEDAAVGTWTLCCNVGGDIFVRQLESKAGRIVRPRPDLCSRVFRDLPPEDEIPRPEWAVPVSMPSTGAPPVLGAGGVAAGGSDGKLHKLVVVDDPTIRFGDSGFIPIEPELDKGDIIVEAPKEEEVLPPPGPPPPPPLSPPGPGGIGQDPGIPGQGGTGQDPGIPGQGGTGQDPLP
jgi:hypothetical protein